MKMYSTRRERVHRVQDTGYLLKYFANYYLHERRHFRRRQHAMEVIIAGQNSGA